MGSVVLCKGGHVSARIGRSCQFQFGWVKTASVLLPQSSFWSWSHLTGTGCRCPPELLIELILNRKKSLKLSSCEEIIQGACKVLHGIALLWVPWLGSLVLLLVWSKRHEKKLGCFWGLAVTSYMYFICEHHWPIPNCPHWAWGFSFSFMVAGLSSFPTLPS